MSVKTERQHHSNPGGPQGPPGPLKGWLKLGVGVGALLLFIYVVGPWGIKLPLFRQIVKVIEEENINANAYYYTEVEEFAEADFAMRATRTYGPKSRMPIERGKP